MAAPRSAGSRAADYSYGVARLAIDGWTAFRDATYKGKSVPANARAAYMAGFDAGLIQRERVGAILKTQGELQKRAIKLEAEVAKLRKQLHYARIAFTNIRRIVNRRVEEEN